MERSRGDFIAAVKCSGGNFVSAEERAGGDVVNVHCAGQDWVGTCISHSAPPYRLWLTKLFE
jgi:hypothetical protein